MKAILNNINRAKNDLENIDAIVIGQGSLTMRFGLKEALVFSERLNSVCNDLLISIKAEMEESPNAKNDL